MDVAMLLGGAVLLYFGAEWLVGGAAGLARALGVPQLIVGLTVVAYGTSAPEVVVSVGAGVSGAGEIALGNVVGSNVANLGLILGAALLLRPARVDAALARREVPVLLVSALAVPLVLLDGVVDRLEGLALLLAAVAYGAWMVVTTRRADSSQASIHVDEMGRAADIAGAPSPDGRARLVLTAIAGLAFLVTGGALFVEGATGLARALGVSERLVGLTIVAVGTSLPELATSLVAARRGHADLAVGNVVGSNIFNALLCLGVAALVAPVRAPRGAWSIDVGCMLAFTVFGAAVMRPGRIMGRVEGAILLGGYVAFLVALGLA